jgi:endoglucanase
MLNGRPFRWRGWRAPVAAIIAAVSLLPAACASPPPGAAGLYRLPGNPLLDAASLLQDNGRPAEAAKLRAIARTPEGIWAAGQRGETAEVRRATAAAARAHSMAVIVAYNVPGRDACGRFSEAAGLSARGYQRWISQLAGAIGDGQDIVIVEPDALPDIVRGCLRPAQAAERYRLLRYAMRVLGALPRARVYLDAGNPGMVADPARLAGPLQRAGLRYGRGFSANTSNFQWTGIMVAWSQRLERALGGRLGAVIDTSRNGLGPYTGPDAPQWCNPPGRALGPRPRLRPGPAGIDAYLWIKDPGASDGPCHGGPPAGQYWPQYALGLAQRTRRQGGPPPAPHQAVSPAAREVTLRPLAAAGGPG